MLLCEPQSLEPCLGAFNLVQREGTVPHEGKPVPCSYGPQDPSALLSETTGTLCLQPHPALVAVTLQSPGTKRRHTY